MFRTVWFNSNGKSGLSLIVYLSKVFSKALLDTFWNYSSDVQRIIWLFHYLYAISKIILQTDEEDQLFARIYCAVLTENSYVCRIL